MAAGEEAKERRAKILRAEAAGPFQTFVVGPLRGDVGGLRRILTRLGFVDEIGAWRGTRRGMLVLVGPFGGPRGDAEELLGYISALAAEAAKAKELGVNADFVLVRHPDEPSLSGTVLASKDVWGWVVTAPGFSAVACKSVLNGAASGGSCGPMGPPRPWMRMAAAINGRRELLDGRPPLRAPQSEVPQAQIYVPGGQGSAGVVADEFRRVIRLESGLGLAGRLCCLWVQDEHVREVAVDEGLISGGEGSMTILNSEQYGERGRGLLEGKRPAEALQAFQEGLAKFPGDHDLGVGRGFALLDLKRPASAKEQFAAVLAAKPDFGDAGQGMVEACFALGQGVEAILAGRAAVPHEERNGEFVHGIAHIFFRYKRYEQAEWFYRQALERAPFHPLATVGLATSLHQQGRAEEAIGVLKEATDKELKRFWEGYSYLGCLLFDTGRAKEAYEVLRRIPLDELRDPAAIERLRSFLNGSRYRKRVKVLNFLADRAREARGESKREKKSKKLADDSPLWPQDGFWQSHPTFVASVGALELDTLFSRHFARPCKFDGVDFPKFKLVPTLEVCLQALEYLAVFFEFYPWVPEGGAGHDRQWQAAGAESLMAYTLAILREGKACLAGEEEIKFKARRLMIAMVAIAETAPVGGRIHATYYYLFREIDRYTQ